MEINGLSVLVTGGCGFIGSSTIDLLLKEHNPGKIIILDNLIRGTINNIEEILKDQRVQFIKNDICNLETVKKVMEGIDIVIHMATLRITACADQPREAFNVMCNGSFNIIEEAQRCGIKKFVTASSASIYGLADSFPTSEMHHPYNNRTWYGATKIFLEGLLRSYSDMYGFPYVALRYFNVYGPRMDIYGKYTEVLIRWMERIESGHDPIIMGDGSQTMDFIFVEDVARANIAALQSDVSDDVFNIASGVETSLNELAAMLLRVMNSDLKPEYAPERKVNPVHRRQANIEKAEKLLGFKTQVSLEEGLSCLVDWWRKQKTS